jgi:hypothetical protein
VETHVLAGGRSLPEKTLELSKAAEEAVEFWFERPFEQWIVGNQDIERQKLWRGNLTNSVTAVVRKHRKIMVQLWSSNCLSIRQNRSW